MKTHFTIGKRHDTGKWEVILDERTSLSNRRRFIKPFRVNKKHPVYSEIHDVESFRRFRFDRETVKAAPKRTEPKPKPLPKRKTVRRVAGSFAERLAAAGATANA